MLKILVVALCGLALYHLTGRTVIPAEVKGLIAMGVAVSVIWFGISRAGEV